MGGMRGWRVKTFRHFEEMENVDQWLERIKTIANVNYNLAVEVANSYRLKKGYGDTYKKGHSKFAMLNKYAADNMNVPEIEEKVRHILSVAIQNHDKKETEKLIASL